MDASVDEGECHGDAKGQLRVEGADGAVYAF
jgi:hypothetical protein